MDDQATDAINKARKPEIDRAFRDANATSDMDGYLMRQGDYRKANIINNERGAPEIPDRQNVLEANRLNRTGVPGGDPNTAGHYYAHEDQLGGRQGIADAYYSTFANDAEIYPVKHKNTALVNSTANNGDPVASIVGQGVNNTLTITPQSRTQVAKMSQRRDDLRNGGGLDGRNTPSSQQAMPEAGFPYPGRQATNPSIPQNSEPVNRGVEAIGQEKYDKLQAMLAKRRQEKAEMNNLDDLKAEQFKTITKTNPMQDDVHTGIRSTKDIKTYDEIMKMTSSQHEAEGDFAYPDWTKEKAARTLAKDEGKITLYSSKPIEDGGFVTPSKMMAQDYAGSGKIYTTEADVNDVAWINGDEGQYAPIKLEATFETTAERNKKYDKSIKNYYRKYGEDFYEKMPDALQERYDNLLDAQPRNKDGVYTDPITGGRSIDATSTPEIATGTEPLSKAADGTPEFVKRYTSQTKLPEGIDNGKAARKSRFGQFIGSLRNSDNSIVQKFYELATNQRKKAIITNLSQNETKRYAAEGNVPIKQNCKVTMSDNALHHLDNEGHLTGIKLKPEENTGIEIDANPLTKDDLAKLDTVLKTPDTITNKGSGREGVKLQIEKRIDDNFRIITEVVDNGGELNIVSVYKQNKSPLTGESTDFGSDSRMSRSDGEVRTESPRSETATLPTIIPQDETNSVNNLKKLRDTLQNETAKQKAENTTRTYESEAERLPDNFDVDRYVTDQVKAQKARSKLDFTPGIDKVKQAFDKSSSQKVLISRNGIDFSIGDFGNSALRNKSGTSNHGLSEIEIKSILNTSNRQSNSGNSSFRKDNVAWFGDLPDGTRGTVITRRNTLGQEEVINAYKNNPGYEDKLISDFGTPAQSRTGNFGLEDHSIGSAIQGRELSDSSDASKLHVNSIIQHESQNPKHKHSKLAENVSNSKNFSAETRQALKDDPITYKPTTNEERLARANKILSTKSIDEADNYLRENYFNVKDKDRNSGDVVLVGEFSKLLDAKGQYDRSTEVINKISKILSKQGQQIQASSMIVNRSPEGIANMAQSAIKKGGGEMTGELRGEIVKKTQELGKIRAKNAN